MSYRQQFIAINNIPKLQPMKPVLAASKKPKPSPYQQYRSKTKSDLNCSVNLLSGLNDIDMQLKQYERLRSKRMSQSQIQSPNLKQIAMTKIASQQSNPAKYSEQKSERTYANNLQIIEECQNIMKTGRTGINLTSSCMLSARTNPNAPKPAIIKGVNGNSKQQDQKKHRLDALKSKTKQLQEEMLSAFPSDLAKQNLINQQMLALMKLLD